MHCVSYAENRADDSGYQRSQPHFPVHCTGDDGRIQDSEPMHDLPQRQADGLGGGAIENLAECFSLADGAIS